MERGPVRTCVGCRIERQRSDLIRVVAISGGVVVADDDRSRPPGRGAYVCYDRGCVERALASGSLRRRLRYDGSLPEGLRDELVRRIEG